MTAYRVETDATISVYYSKISTYDIGVQSEHSTLREEERLKEILEFITDKFPELEVEINGIETVYEEIERDRWATNHCSEITLRDDPQ